MLIHARGQLKDITSQAYADITVFQYAFRVGDIGLCGLLLKHANLQDKETAWLAQQLQGIFLEKQRGAYRGRKKSLSQEQVNELKKRGGSGREKTSIARRFGISRETLYQYIRS